MRMCAQRPGRMTMAGLFALASLLLAAPALAQEGEAAGAGEGGDPKAQGPIDPIPTDIQEDDPRFWAQVRGIDAIQKREILKEGRFGLTLYGGIIPNNIFSQYFPLGMRLNYFVLETLGLEVSGNYSCGFRRTDEEREQDVRQCGLPTRLRNTVSDPQGVGASSVLLGDEQIAHFNFGVTWSPIFGKTAWHNRSIRYFDVYVFGGVGMVVKQTTPDVGAAPQVGLDPEGALGAGAMYFLGNHLALRLDFRQFLFQKITGGVATPSEVSLGVMLMP